MNKLPSELCWKVQEHFSSGKVTVTLCRTPERSVLPHRAFTTRKDPFTNDY
jgi:hypothetical protein